MLLVVQEPVLLVAELVLLVRSTTQEQIRICFGWKLKHASYKSNEPDLVQKLKHTTKERVAVKFQVECE